MEIGPTYSNQKIYNKPTNVFKSNEMSRNKTEKFIFLLCIFAMFSKQLSCMEINNRDQREAPTADLSETGEFLLSQRGQVILAIILGTAGYLCCVILPCCLGACSIFLLNCVNLIEYPDTPVKKVQDMMGTKIANKQNQKQVESNREDLNRERSEATTEQLTIPDQIYNPTQTQCLYQYIPYQFNYTASGPQAATHSYPNPMYTPELYQAETLYNDVYVAPQEQVYENYNAGAGAAAAAAANEQVYENC